MITRDQAFQIFAQFRQECQNWAILPQGIEHIGSSTYHSDANDVDIMVMVPDKQAYMELCHALGFSYAPNANEYPGEWESMKKGDLNLLITADSDYYYASRTASDVCRALKLKTRKERVIVHRVIVDKMRHQEAIHSVADMDG